MCKTLIWVALEPGVLSWTHLGIFGFRGAVLEPDDNKERWFQFQGSCLSVAICARAKQRRWKKNTKKLKIFSLSSFSNSLFSLSKTIFVWYFYHLILRFIPYHPLPAIFSTYLPINFLLWASKGKLWEV